MPINDRRLAPSGSVPSLNVVKNLLESNDTLMGRYKTNNTICETFKGNKIMPTTIPI